MPNTTLLRPIALDVGCCIRIDTRIVGFTIRPMLQRFNHKNVSWHLVIRQQNKRTALTNRTAVANLAGTDLVDRFANILCHLYFHLSKLEI
jgi:hypothetical protein